MTRRTYGTGALRHLDGDRYRFQIRADGRQLSRVFTARNGTEANKTAAGLRAELLEAHEKRQDAAGVEHERRRAWTVERYVDHYLEAWAPYHLADTTRARYAGILEHNVCPYIGTLPMCEVTPADLAGLYATLSSANGRKRGGDGALSGSTVATVHNVIRALFTFAVEIEGDLTTSPAASKAARPKVDRAPRQRAGMTVAEVEAFVSLAADKAPRIAVPVMLSAYLGTRRGETVGLRWGDVDFTAARITVCRSVSRTVADGVKVKGTKTGRERTIPLDAHTIAELKRIQREQRTERLRFGRGWRGAELPAEDHIATEPDGSPMRPDVFSSCFRTLCEQEKVEHITPHLLRHAWVSQMVALGYDAVTISAMSGHSPDVLLRVYAHAFDARKREAIDALGEARQAARAAQ